MHTPPIDHARRRILLATAGLAGLSLAGCSARLLAAPKFLSDPFTLGVACGEPDAQGFVIWTRLAPEPLADDGGMPAAAVEVRWEVALDEGFRKLARTGIALAEPGAAHTLHVEVAGLEPGRDYWYRFDVSDARSPIGRARTLPAVDAKVARFRIDAACCQHYEDGYFGAYRHLAADMPDLVLHLGDYIYEGSIQHPLRAHLGSEPVSLAEYRRRHAQYRLDPDLQRAHAACPWFMVWDDHDVENDYAGSVPEDLSAPEAFLLRRAAAYQAYYEHLPLRRRAHPRDGVARLYTQARIGSLATLLMLDERQYRDDQACPGETYGGGRLVGDDDCPQRLDPQRSLLGSVQERWLDAQLRDSRTTWKALGQQLLMAPMDQQPGPGKTWWSDGWDGYPAARGRLLQTLADARVANPVVLGGDIHAFLATELQVQGHGVASEFVATSLSSRGVPHERFSAMLPDNPHIKFFDSRQRGYLRCELSPGQWRSDFIALDDVRRADSPARVLKSFVVEAGRPGPVPTSLDTHATRDERGSA
ncbi:MAG TPA: alkaline phosphatase D family protein [Solimonas sp.]|nr:alkaline phosphatase D family protein [Solimonas sp.]